VGLGSGCGYRTSIKWARGYSSNQVSGKREITEPFLGPQRSMKGKSERVGGSLHRSNVEECRIKME